MENQLCKSRKRVLILAYSALDRDPRVSRQIQFLSDDYDVVAFGNTPPQEAVSAFIPSNSQPAALKEKISLAASLLARRFDRVYWDLKGNRQALERLRDVQADLIIANDIDTLPLALALIDGKRVVADLHEYAPRHLEGDWKWRVFWQNYFTSLCHQYIPQIGAAITVSDTIAAEYTKVFHKPFDVITNAPFYADYSYQPVNPASVRMIHHGAAHPVRRLENMIYLMDDVDGRFHLDLMLMPLMADYMKKLERLAAKRKNVRLIPAVSANRIVETCHQYDIGLSLLEPTSFNLKYCLPNKFFEFVQAKIALASGPSPEMARLIYKHGCGVVSEDFKPQSLAKKLNALTSSQIDAMKVASQNCSSELCAERNRERFLRIVQKRFAG